ncbi:unnamed protein product, partial [Amoebophrya sp. A120]
IGQKFSSVVNYCSTQVVVVAIPLLYGRFRSSYTSLGFIKLQIISCNKNCRKWAHATETGGGTWAQEHATVAVTAIITNRVHHRP